MAKPKSTLVNRKQMAETGEALETVGAAAEIAGSQEAIEGLEDLEVAREAGRIGVGEAMAGASDLTRAVDMAVAADRLSDLSEVVAAAGEREVLEGLVRLTVADAAAERSAELAVGSAVLAAAGGDELETAALAGAVAQEAGREGVAKIAEGSEIAGAGEATVAAGEALEVRARR